MTFEKYYGIYKDEKGITLRPKKGSAKFNFTADVKKDKRYKLFAVGETAQFYWWKDEPDGNLLYREITDGLNYEQAELDRFCLDFSANSAFTYIKRVYKKVLWSPVASYIPINPVPAEWKAGIRVKAENLNIREDGFLRMRIEIRLLRENVSRHDVTVPSDMTVILPVEPGTYGYTEIFKNITIPQNTANVCVFVEGKNYTGKCYFEHPELSADIHNMLPAFAEPVSGKPEFDWSGQFISRKELPEFEIVLNGNTVYSGEIFERIHRFAEWEVSLPNERLKENNTLEIKLISSYREALPYNLCEVALLEQPDSDIDIIAVSEFAPVGGKARVLLRTKNERETVKFVTECNEISAENEYYFEEKGLHGIAIDCLKPSQNAVFTLSTENCTAQGEVKNIIRKNEDKVITGTGDMIYILQEKEAMEEYISWYVSNGVGNFITMRPCYRWAGTTQLDAEAVKWFAKLMNELEIKYVLMMDGREVPGLASQPSNELLSGKNYLGRQEHEVDGALAYWGERVIGNLSAEQASELMLYTYQENREYSCAKSDERSFLYKGEQLVRYNRKAEIPADYALAHKKFLSDIKNVVSEDSTRHTGPSCLFKYFAEGGLKWMGAETMYSSMEILLGFLRGAAKLENTDVFGVHHALQWSTTPHECEQHYKRFRLALYTAYMMGATDINTEEGLWRLEEGYEHHHRFGTACGEHLKQQQDFYRYVSSHTRSGSFYSPIALVHGRDDGVNFFVPNKIWGLAIPFTSAEKSWELTKEVYPESVPGKCLYFHKCPTDRAMGYYSTTPYGNVDVLPAEANVQTMADYKLLVFMGYNRLTDEDADKLYNYVKNGGKVLMTRAHLTTTTDIEKVRRGELEFGQIPFKCEGAEGELCVENIGNGTAYIFNTNKYPSDLSEQYTAVMKKLMQQVQSEENVWAKCGKGVEFSCFKQPNGDTHLYLLAVDWFNNSTEPRKAVVKVGNVSYEAEIPFGVLIKVVSNGKIAVWSESEQGEILALDQSTATVQGSGRVTFAIAKNGEMFKKTVDFTAENVQKINL